MPASFTAGLPPEFPFPQPRRVAPSSESTSPPVPMIYESADPEPLSPRAYAAIHLCVPDSGIEWLDEMIRKSRQLDARRMP